MLFNPALSLSKKIGRLNKIPYEINAKESVVNLAIPHSDEAIAKIDKFIKILNFEPKNDIKLFIDNSFTY